MSWNLYENIFLDLIISHQRSLLLLSVSSSWLSDRIDPCAKPYPGFLSNIVLLNIKPFHVAIYYLRKYVFIQYMNETILDCDLTYLSLPPRHKYFSATDERINYIALYVTYLCQSVRATTLMCRNKPYYSNYYHTFSHNLVDFQPCTFPHYMALRYGTTHLQANTTRLV